MNLLFGFARGLNTKQYAMQLVTDPNQIEKEHADGYLITGARNKDYELFDNSISLLFYLVKITAAMTLLILIIS